MLNFFKEQVDYASLYSVLIALLAFICSIIFFILSNIISKNRIKKDRQISDARYIEQKEQYEARLKEERERREEDKREAEERIRISERPYFVCKETKLDYYDREKSQVVFALSFINKGRGAAYEIAPDTKCLASLYGNTFTIFRHDYVENHIVGVNETVEVKWFYQTSIIKNNFRMPFTINFKDSSEREYKQDFVVDITSNNTMNSISYARPMLCKKQQ